MIISLSLLLPVYLVLVWIDRHTTGQVRMRREWLAYIAVLVSTVVVVTMCHRFMLGEPGIWPFVLAPLLGYATMVLGFVSKFWWCGRR